MADETKPKSETTSDATVKNTADGGKGEDTQASKTEDAKTFTQADLDRIAGEARKSEREKAKREADEADKKKQEAADKEAGKHKELAAQFESERDTEKAKAEALETKYNLLSESIGKMIQSDIDDLPDEVKALAPESLEARLEWLPKAKALAGKFGEGNTKPGNSLSPKPKGGKDAVTAHTDAKNALRQRGGYGM